MKRATALLTLAAGLVIVGGGAVGLTFAALKVFPPVEEPSRELPGSPSSSIPISSTATNAPHPESTEWKPTPTAVRTLTLIDYEHFRVGYDERAKNPAWVCYRLSGPIVETGRENRASKFQTDFHTSAHVADSDYRNSGYDRGHLCPAYAIFSRFGQAAMKTTFVMSNVIPQHHGLNAGEWEQLEEAIAGRAGKGDGWAQRYGPLWIVNGPIYDTQPAAERLPNGTWIPTACFSVVLRQREQHWEALAFVMPNTSRVDGPVSRYLTTISLIERATGLSLVQGLPIEDQNRLRMARAASLWP